ncbi:hypothetical protein RhiirB3_404708 [Rhizophagus irregularis]|nr:hypothetical protein RhiirB3_404708 [Rhizophagus irregularis]
MNHPKYNGNIHPDEWINDLQAYYNIKQNFININNVNVNIISLKTFLLQYLRIRIKENYNH